MKKTVSAAFVALAVMPGGAHAEAHFCAGSVKAFAPCALHRPGEHAMRKTVVAFMAPAVMTGAAHGRRLRQISRMLFVRLSKTTPNLRRP